MKIKNKKQLWLSTGFTLVELLIVFSVSGLIAVITMKSYPNFSSNIEFENTALDIALTIREAQVYGVGAKEVSIGTPVDPFDVAYGVSFDATNANSYILFADINNNKQYDNGEEIETFTIKSNFRIKDICIDSSNCYLPLLLQNPLDITFKRPNPDGIIMLNGVSGSFGSVEIENIKNGKTKTITVTNTGQISTQ